MTHADTLARPAAEPLRVPDDLMTALKQAGTIAWAQRGETLCREGESTDHIHIVTAGFVVAVKRTAEGHQQNVALFLPNDIVGHERFTLGTARCAAMALTPVTSHRVSLSRLRQVLDADSGHAAAFWRYIAFHGALAHEWMLGLGRRSAYARTAHLLCEIIYRTSGRNAATESSCPMPLTQTELADTLGLSVVHVNRTLMRFKQEGLINLRRGHIDVLDWPRFKAAAGFEASYLLS